MTPTKAQQQEMNNILTRIEELEKMYSDTLTEEETMLINEELERLDMQATLIREQVSRK